MSGDFYGQMTNANLFISNNANPYLISPYAPLGNLVLAGGQLRLSADTLEPSSPGGTIVINGNLTVASGFVLRIGSLQVYTDRIYSGSTGTGPVMQASGDGALGTVDATINGVNEMTISQGKVSVAGDLEVDGSFIIGGNYTINGLLTANGGIFSNSSITSTGTIASAANLVADGDIYTTGLGSSNIYTSGTGSIGSANNVVAAGDIYTTGTGSSNIYTSGAGNISTTGTGSISSAVNVTAAGNIYTTGTGNIASATYIQATTDVKTPEVTYSVESKAANGYQKNGQLIQQWGSVAYAGASVSVSFNVAAPFTTTPNVTATLLSTNLGANLVHSLILSAASSTGFTVECRYHDTTGTAAPSNDAGTIYWQAIGV